MREIDEYAEKIRTGTHAWELLHSKAPEYCSADHKQTKKFDKEQLIEELTDKTESCLVFHRDSSFLQAGDVISENYLYDFMMQAVELDEVKEKLL